MTTAPDTGFNRLGLTILIGFGLVFAAVFVLLSAFGPGMKPGRDGRAHALSVSATGFAGIVRLADAAGLSVRVGRDENAARSAALLVLTPDPGTSPADIEKRVRSRAGTPTLVILPKWNTVPTPLHPGWVESVGTNNPAMSAKLLEKLLPGLAIADNLVPAGARLDHDGGTVIARPAPPGTRSLRPDSGLDAILVDTSGHMVIGWSARHNLYVLAEPDLFANAGIRDLAAARVAAAILADMRADRPGAIVFDVTLNGLGVGRSLLRTAFEPPFLALTLALLVAAMLAAWHGMIGFGTPQPAPRAIAFGKRALVENVASLIRMAGREPAAARRYAALMRSAAATRLHAPGEDLGPHTDEYAALAHAAEIADNRAAALAAAQALYCWQETIRP